MLKSDNETQAIRKVKDLHPDKYIYCFGESGNTFDVAVYNSKSDYLRDESEGDNSRIIARFSIEKVG